MKKKQETAEGRDRRVPENRRQKMAHRWDVGDETRSTISWEETETRTKLWSPVNGERAPAGAGLFEIQAGRVAMRACSY